MFKIIEFINAMEIMILTKISEGNEKNSALHLELK